MGACSAPKILVRRMGKCFCMERLRGAPIMLVLAAFLERRHGRSKDRPSALIRRLPPNLQVSFRAKCETNVLFEDL
jgi:hypothetical protein